MLFVMAVTTSSKASSIALDAIASNKVRAALTILGVAVGVFVVVTLSAAVHGINESVAKDLESAGPTSFYMYRRPVGLTTICDGTDDTCTWRRNPPITLDESKRDRRAAGDQGGHESHRFRRASSSTRTSRSTRRGLDGYSARVAGRRRRRHQRRPRFHLRRSDDGRECGRHQ